MKQADGAFTPIHWGQETVYSKAVAVGSFSEAFEVSVSAEVPMRGDVRLLRHGHRCYGTHVTIEGPDHAWLSVDEARELAQRLIEAADAADAIDRPDQDRCGHWAPCDCEARLPAAGEAGSLDSSKTLNDAEPQSSQRFAAMPEQEKA